MFLFSFTFRESEVNPIQFARACVMASFSLGFPNFSVTFGSLMPRVQPSRLFLFFTFLTVCGLRVCIAARHLLSLHSSIAFDSSYGGHSHVTRVHCNPMVAHVRPFALSRRSSHIVPMLCGQYSHAPITFAFFSSCLSLGPSLLTRPRSP